MEELWVLFWCADCTLCIMHHKWHLLGTQLSPSHFYSWCKSPPAPDKCSLDSFLPWMSKPPTPSSGNMWHICWSWRINRIYAGVHYYWLAILFIWCWAEYGHQQVSTIGSHIVVVMMVCAVVTMMICAVVCRLWSEAKQNWWSSYSSSKSKTKNCECLRSRSKSCVIKERKKQGHIRHILRTTWFLFLPDFKSLHQSTSHIFKAYEYLIKHFLY